MRHLSPYVERNALQLPRISDPGTLSPTNQTLEAGEEQTSMNEDTSLRSHQLDLSFAEMMGRLFELGFNTGLLAAITQRTDLTHHFGALYENELRHLHLPPLIEAAQQLVKPISAFDRESLQRWVHFLLLKGYLAGSNLLVEFLQTIRGGKDWEG